MEEVRQEIFDESYRTEKVLREYLDKGSVDIVALRNLEELSQYNRYSRNLDSGDAATIVATTTMDGIIATDDSDVNSVFGVPTNSGRILPILFNPSLRNNLCRYHPIVFLGWLTGL